MHERLRDDLTVSHAFINTLTAAYQGAYAFEQALGQLGATDAEARADAVSERIDEINAWWAVFKRHEPLLAVGTELSPDAVRAWQLLGDAEERLRGLANEMRPAAETRALFADRTALYLRVACFCESAYAGEHFVHGLICYGDVMNMPDVSDRYRQHLQSCQAQVREAHTVLSRAVQLPGAPSEAEVAELLDVTLTVPVLFAHRILDIRQVLARYTGRFDFLEGGIAEHEQEPWQRLGFPPYAAGQWRAAGFSPQQAYEWIQGGVPDALGAAGYLGRDLVLEIAVPWFAAGMNGREAAAWLDAGISVQEASSWQARGVHHPTHRSQIA